MTKLMTAVAVMQCVENGLVDLDKSVSGVLPEIGTFGIITNFNKETNELSFKPNTVPITLR
jgi:CubicO group peptidase (beta-lactamase class C family)